MNNIKEYFHTDWAAMTQHDWLGLIITIAVFLIMIGLYVYILHPANKERLESLRHMPFEEENDVLLDTQQSRITKVRQHNSE